MGPNRRLLPTCGKSILPKLQNGLGIKVQLNNQDVKLNQKETQIVESYFKALVNRLDKEIAQLCRL
jgi:hypothetical protein